MYGMFIPILFLVSLFGMFNMYAVERLSLAYVFRQPPHFDSSINSSAIQMLKLAPLMMFGLGYWALGNRQVFFNETQKEVIHSNAPPNPNHDPFSEWSTDTEGAGYHVHLCLLMLVFLSLTTIFGNSVYCVVMKLFCISKDYTETKDVTEDLDEYWQNIVGKE